MLQHHIRHGLTVRCGAPGFNSALLQVIMGGQITTEAKYPPGCDFSRIPRFRNFCCVNYSFCLSAHALRGSTGFDCHGCCYAGDREPIDPTEGGRCLALLAEVYRVDLSRLLADMESRPAAIDKTAGRWFQPVGMVSA
jgi:hypothetical protein